MASSRKESDPEVSRNKSIFRKERGMYIVQQFLIFVKVYNIENVKVGR